MKKMYYSKVQWGHRNSVSRSTSRMGVQYARCTQCSQPGSLSPVHNFKACSPQSWWKAGITRTAGVIIFFLRIRIISSWCNMDTTGTRCWWYRLWTLGTRLGTTEILISTWLERRGEFRIMLGSLRLCSSVASYLLFLVMVLPLSILPMVFLFFLGGFSSRQVMTECWITLRKWGWGLALWHVSVISLFCGSKAHDGSSDEAGITAG